MTVTTIDLESYGELAAILEEAPDLYQSALARALWEIVEFDIMPESRYECPKDTRTLVRSSTVEKPTVTDGNITIEFGYGTNYAVYVHELPTILSSPKDVTRLSGYRKRKRAEAALFRALGAFIESGGKPSKGKSKKASGLRMPAAGQYHKPPTKSKFLEDPVNRNLDALSEMIAIRMDEIFARRSRQALELTERRAEAAFLESESPVTGFDAFNTEE